MERSPHFGDYFPNFTVDESIGIESFIEGQIRYFVIELSIVPQIRNIRN